MFDLDRAGVRREIRAGVTTFMTMAYIVVVHPLILADAGMPRDGVMTATCLAAALGCFLMAFLTNYPFALAPGLGLNAFFAYSVVLGMGISWQGALAAVFLAGLVFVVLSVTPVREAIINGIPMSLKAATSVGIGLFIALVGLENAGLVVYSPATRSLGLVGERYFSDPALQALLPQGASVASVGLAIAGLLLTTALVALQVRGALLWGILAVTVLGVPLGVTGDGAAGSLVGWPTGLGEVFLAMSFSDLFGAGPAVVFAVIFTFTFVDLFDTTGTLVGVAGKAGMLDQEGRLPRVRGALLADSLATVGGAALGTSTTTTYIESASGIAAGGRTGLTALTTGALFLVTLFCGPMVMQIPRVATAPALIIVGVYMMEPVRRIDFGDFLDAVPAFLTIVIMPLAFSISEGIVVGILAHVFLRLVTGRAGQVHLALWVLSAFFILRFLIA